MGPYFGCDPTVYYDRWLDLGKKLKSPPHFYFTNFFRKNKSGKYIWPGYGQNSRILKWIFERTIFPERYSAVQTAIGLIPNISQLDTLGNLFLS